MEEIRMELITKKDGSNVTIEITGWLEQIEHLIHALTFSKMRPDTKIVYIFIRNFDFHMKSIRQLSCNLLQRQIIKMKMAVAPTGSRIIFFCFFFL